MNLMHSLSLVGLQVPRYYRFLFLYQNFQSKWGECEIRLQAEYEGKFCTITQEQVHHLVQVPFLVMIERSVHGHCFDIQQDTSPTYLQILFHPLIDG